MLTALTGSSCTPGALAVFLCGSNGFGTCHAGADTQIIGATFIPSNPGSPLSVVAIILPSPPAPLLVGQKVYFTDGCTDPLLSPPAIVTGPAAAPLMSPSAIFLLAASLGLIGLIGLSRMHWGKG